MAKQKGIIKLEGTLGDITFVKTADGYIAKERTSLSGDRIKNDPAFQRTRENYSEFGGAATTGKIIRAAFRPLYSGIADSRMTGRLTKALMRIIRTDAVNLRGERRAHEGELALLQGFNFSRDASLSSKLYVQYTTTIDRVTGSANIALPAFAPGKMVSAPSGATHFRLISGIVQIDFATEHYTLTQARSAEILVNNPVEVQLQLPMVFEPGTEDVLLLAFGIEFMQVVNGQSYPLNDSGYSALAIVQVDYIGA
jgi:hypothetical protein